LCVYVIEFVCVLCVYVIVSVCVCVRVCCAWCVVYKQLLQLKGKTKACMK